MKKRLVVSAAILATVALPTVAMASWSASSTSGTGRAVAANLTTVTPTVTTISSSELDVTWSNPSGQLAGTTYSVARDGSTICAAPATSPCKDQGLGVGTTHQYVLTAVLGNWGAASGNVAGTTSNAVTNPTITSPNSTAVTHLKKNTSGQTFVIAGTGFQTGVNVTISDATYTVTNVNRTSATSITVTVSDGYTDSGTHAANVTVTNPDAGTATSNLAIDNKG